MEKTPNPHGQEVQITSCTETDAMGTDFKWFSFSIHNKYTSPDHYAFEGA